MKKSFVSIWFLLLFFLNSSHAEIQIVKSVRQSVVKEDLKRLYDSTILKYLNENEKIFDGYSHGRADLSFGSVFLWRLNGNLFYSNITSFVPRDDAVLPACENYPKDARAKNDWPGPNCDRIEFQSLQCHLFMLRINGGIGGVGRIWIHRDENLIEGKPNCIDVKAIAVAKIIPDSFLITLSYLDSAAYVEPKSMPDEYQTTVLLKLKEESSGTLTITQDDSCLGNPNRIASIAAARERLEQCAKASK